MANSARIRRERLLTEAEGYLMLDMPRHALDALDAIADPEREPFDINFQRGLALRSLEQHAEALDAFDKAHVEDPDNISLLLAMAWCYKRTDQLHKAISTMEHAYRVKPTEAIVLYNLSCYWALAANKAQALTWLGRALRLDQSLRQLIPDEHDFDLIRDDPDFETVAGLPDDASRST